GRRTNALNLDFLNDVHARFGARYALARTGEIRAIDEKHVLTDARPERGYGVDGAAGWRRGRHTWSRPDQIKHAVATRGDRFDVLRSKATFKPAVSGFESGTGSLNHNRYGHAFHLQDNRSLQSGARADADVVLVIRSKSRHLDVERVRSGSQIRKPELAGFARRHGLGSANQRRGSNTNLTAGNRGPCSSLAVPMRVPVRVCAAATCVDKPHAAVTIAMNQTHALGFI